MNFTFFKKDGLLSKGLEAIIDIFLILLSYYLAFQFIFNFQPSITNIQPFYDIIPYIAIVTFVTFSITHMFSMLKRSIVDIVSNLIISLIVINLATISIIFFSRGFAFPRSVFILSFIVQFVLLLLSKLIVINILKCKYKKKKILIVGSREDSANIAKRLLMDKNNLDSLHYLCTDEIDNNIFKLITEVDKIYIGSSVDNKIKSDIISYCIGKDKVVYLVPELFEIAMIKAKTVQLDDVPVFEIDNLHLSIEEQIIKRVFDLILSTIGLIIAIPIMAIVAIIIKLYDRGPVLFTQSRVTQGNKSFNVYKFRTMVVDAEKKTGPVLATEKDPRITPLGRFLRATRIDELPQLFNVFKGDMSMVGPRPERQHFIDQFTEEIPHFKYRVVVKAGVTGLAQVLGKYTTSPEDKVRFDLLYIRNYSILLDIEIILKTIKVVFLKESSSGVKDDKSLKEIFDEMNIKVYEETSVTKLD
ncbi:MAG: sugar transferase [Halanaerobiales bacterium]